MTTREHPPLNWMAVDNPTRLGRMSDLGGWGHRVSAGWAQAAELGDTASVPRAVPQVVQVAAARRTHLKGYELHSHSQLWQDVVARHPPYRPPSRWRDEL